MGDPNIRPLTVGELQSAYVSCELSVSSDGLTAIATAVVQVERGKHVYRYSFAEFKAAAVQGWHRATERANTEEYGGFGGMNEG